MADELSPSQAAARIGATTRSVQRWIVAGRLPARRVGGRWRVASDALDAFVAGDNAEHRQSAGSAGQSPIIRQLFVANRGEIAARIRRTCDRLGIETIVPPTDGPDSVDLLDIAAVVGAALAAHADAVHPGFGFLAENVAFAEAVVAAGIRWIGPPPAAIRAMGDKAAARQLARRLGIPTIGGYDGDEQADAVLTRAAPRIGFPLLVKPAAGPPSGCRRRSRRRRTRRSRRGSRSRDAARPRGRRSRRRGSRRCRGGQPSRVPRPRA
jgi:excisionase family DNA binding protein